MVENMICEGPVYLNNGWICPRCGASVAPDMKVCPNCSTANTTIVYTPKNDKRTTCSWNYENKNDNEQIILS